ncbi:hypothetical protein [Geodermatophilus ruber]|uniref:Uncharacterized protein n=1 Tax=Geodermatophilus ruber TaxID=504800 RepID=A0A1I3Z3I6_9ACTN|nr:hypothetical protein [Geodermatophilus ruber]SFK38570.1 hypothetical protein SAMN04488085_101327 [Geodermatophilus ruber]
MTVEPRAPDGDLDAWAERIATEAPKLTAAQRKRLRVLLRPPARRPAGAA